jgi:hypothetical protein
VRHLIGCFDIHLLTRLGHRKYQAAPTWKRHVHINGTIYYSLETQDPNLLFRRIITAEDVTDPDIQTAIEECGEEYHEWLEEADLEDLPHDLELLVHFDNPYRRETIGSFMSYQKQVKFTCCPRDDDADSESGYASSSSVPMSYRIGFPISLFYTRSTELPVVVEVFLKQSFWLAVESYPMHHTHSHRNLEVAFFEALVYSANGMTWRQSLNPSCY